MLIEFFPPTETELEELIYNLQKQLEDERFRSKWKEIAEILEDTEKQLKELIINNNAL